MTQDPETPGEANTEARQPSRIVVRDAPSLPALAANLVVPGMYGDMVQLDFVYISTVMSEQIQSGDIPNPYEVDAVARVVLSPGVMELLIAAYTNLREQHLNRRQGGGDDSSGSAS